MMRQFRELRQGITFCVVSVWLFELPQLAAIRLQLPNCISSNVVGTRQRRGIFSQGLGAETVLVGVIACGITPLVPSCIASLILRLEKTTGQLSVSVVEEDGLFPGQSNSPDYSKQVALLGLLAEKEMLQSHFYSYLCFVHHL